MSTRTIETVWIEPPMAFARFGESTIPMENFHWADNDYAPRSTAETVIEPTWSLSVGNDGTLTCHKPEVLVFRDGEHWRPVCPFFEVHARLSDGTEAPLTVAHLHEAGCDLDGVVWEIHAANRKAFHYTNNDADRVDANVSVRGDDHAAVRLNARSPEGSTNPIVPEGTPLPLGSVQVIRPTAQFPVVRIRITPPAGRIYAPSNTADRDLTALLPADLGQDEFLDGICTVLNPSSDWATWSPTNGDSRTNPGGLYAQTPTGESLGFLDDSNDGKITFRLTNDSLPNGELTATARFTCCPPDFQPDRRPFVSVADGLADQQLREEVFDAAFVDEHWEQTEGEVADLLERVRETMEASNLDHQNLRSALANINPPVSAEDPLLYPFAPQDPRPGHPFPLLERGRANHRRFLAFDVFKQRLVKYPDLFEQIVRKPTDEPGAYDSKMPALMRGSDANPLTLTQREYQLLAAWLDRLDAR